MANTVPLKHRKIAAELIAQIDRLSARWHLDFSTVERGVIRKALAAHAEKLKRSHTKSA